MWFMRPSNRSCDPWETMWQVMWSTSDHVIDERPCDRSCDPPVIMWSTRDHVTGHVIHQWSCDPQETMWQVMWSTSDHVIYERPCDRSCDLPNLLCYMQPNIAYACVCLLIWDHNPSKRFYVLKWLCLMIFNQLFLITENLNLPSKRGSWYVCVALYNMLHTGNVQWFIWSCCDQRQIFMVVKCIGNKVCISCVLVIKYVSHMYWW